MKKLLILIALPLILAACGGDNEESPTNSSGTVASQSTIEKPKYMIQIPSSWSEISPAEYAGALMNNSAQAVFRSNVADAGTYSNVVVATDSIPRNITALEFSRAKAENESAVLPGYQLINQTEITVSEQQTVLSEFQAQSKIGGKTLRFYQIALVKDGKGYVFLGGAAPDANDQTFDTIRQALQSVQLK